MRRVEESRSREVEKETARRPDDQTASRGDACIARGSTRWRLDEPEMVEIWPEPAPAEREAILIALEQMQDGSTQEIRSLLPAWAAAGRRESVLGQQAGSPTGWGRASDRLANW